MKAFDFFEIEGPFFHQSFVFYALVKPEDVWFLSYSQWRPKKKSGLMDD